MALLWGGGGLHTVLGGGCGWGRGEGGEIHEMNYNAFKYFRGTIFAKL